MGGLYLKYCYRTSRNKEIKHCKEEVNEISVNYLGTSLQDISNISLAFVSGTINTRWYFAGTKNGP